MRYLTLASIMAAALCLSSTQQANAGRPVYIVLESAHTGPHTAGYAVPAQKTGYAWGFFGARAQPQSYWQQGYYQNYKQKTVIEPYR